MSLYDGTEASVRLCFRWSTLSNMNMSETSWQIVIKFHLEHHWGREFAELAIGPDQKLGFHGNRQLPWVYNGGKSCDNSSPIIFF